MKRMEFEELFWFLNYSKIDRVFTEDGVSLMTLRDQTDEILQNCNEIPKSKTPTKPTYVPYFLQELQKNLSPTEIKELELEEIISMILK